MNKYIEQGYQWEKNIKKNGQLSSARTAVNGFENRKMLNVFDKIPVGKFLGNCLLAAQTNENLIKFLPFSEKISFSSDEYLYEQGDRVEWLYFPETAVFSEFQILEDGRTIEVAMTGREGVVGLLPVFNTNRAANWTQVSIAGSAFKINTGIFKNEIYRNQSLQTSIFGYINDYVGQISQRAVCNICHSLEERFCSWLLMLQDRKNSPKLSLTHEKIARSLGVHRPSITHIAQTLREKKIIDYIRGKIYILNREKLEKSACICYSEIDKNFSNNY